jgi:Flp pilus assembly protein TadD
MLTTFSQWESSGKIPMLARLKTMLEFGALMAGGRESTGARPPQLHQMMVVAEQLYRQNQDDDALSLLDRIIRNTPDSAQAHLLKGQIHERQKDYAAAIVEFRAAAFWDPKMTMAYVGLGRIYWTLGEQEQAREQIQRALALDPKHPDVLALQRTLESAGRK